MGANNVQRHESAINNIFQLQTWVEVGVGHYIYMVAAIIKKSWSQPQIISAHNAARLVGDGGKGVVLTRVDLLSSTIRNNFILFPGRVGFRFQGLPEETRLAPEI